MNEMFTEVNKYIDYAWLSSFPSQTNAGSFQERCHYLVAIFFLWVLEAA